MEARLKYVRVYYNCLMFDVLGKTKDIPTTCHGFKSEALQTNIEIKFSAN